MTEEITVEARKSDGTVPARASRVDLSPDTGTWDALVGRSTPGSYLQTSAWAEVKAANGWQASRFIGSLPAQAAGEASEFGVQMLIRKPRLFPWAFAYAPRGPVLERWDAATLEAFSAALRRAVAASPGRISHVRIEPEIEINGPQDVDGSLRHALRACGWRPATPIQPARTRQVDLTVGEEALWGNLRKKWRQYVNKARKADVRVVDATVDRLPEFYSIYRDTAKRAGFVIRTYDSYKGVWEAFAKLGMARLLFAEGPDGSALATLFLLRVGNRVVEPYGGMTPAGAESRANYLLKWEAMRTSLEQGAVSYDMWGISHEGIEHFKAGFGGREIKYVGAWDLVLDKLGRLTYDAAQIAQDRVGAWRHGIRKVRGRSHAPVETEEAAE
jgi:peptidoglycan pentaglycine glycine transferase (the first glycine)